MKLLPVYLRKVWTLDQIIGRPFRYDVAAYSDPGATKLKARWPWFAKAKPTRRNRRVTLNCYQWAAVWLPDVNA